MNLEKLKQILFCFVILLFTTNVFSAGTNGYPALGISDLDPVSQLHGDPVNADLRIFMAGNQFVVMDELVRAFKKEYPKYSNIFYVTLHLVQN